MGAPLLAVFARSGLLVQKGTKSSHALSFCHPSRMTAAQHQKTLFWKLVLHKHSLSIATTLVLTTWIVLYTRSNPASHLGSFFGNAIADWTGLLVTVLATKYLYEIGSAESRTPPHKLLRPLAKLLEQHSLTIFLLLTGAGWTWLFAVSDPTSKWGQVVGNIVSEWTQILGMVVLTKRLLETHSKESRR
jgi:hypothetical protein